MRGHRAIAFLLMAVFACAACSSQPPRSPQTYLPAACDDPNAGPSTPLVYLKVDAKQHALVQREAHGEWCTLCLAPCNGYVPAAGVYRMWLGDWNGSSTKEFSMPNVSSVTLAVDGDGNVQTRRPPRGSRPMYFR